MGDRVVFATRQYDSPPDTSIVTGRPFYPSGGGGYLAGGSSGFSGFPFPWVPGVGVTNAGGTFPPGAISLQIAGGWYWRIRKWHLSGGISLSFDYDDGMGGIATITFTASFDDIIDVWADAGVVREFDLILNTIMNATFNGTWTCPFGPQSGAATARFQLFFPDGHEQLLFDPATGYYPTLLFIVDMGGISIPDPAFILTTDATAAAGSFGAPPNLSTLVLDELNVSMTGTSGYLRNSGDCSLVLTPATGTANAFWEHANADGSPKFNTSTGALL
jgi:hypothetical protein